MSPTVPTAANNVEQHKRPTLVKPHSAERRSELVCQVKYCNTLPDIPFDPKFIQYPFESTRFIQYNPTSLERNYKYEVLTEHDLGVTIDLINKDMYAADPNAILDPADEKLLEEDILAPHDSKRSRHHSRSVSWLRRTEYISTEQTRFQPQVMDKVEAKVGFRIKKSLKEETVFLDRESQIKAIDKTFEDNKKPIEKHHSKPNVTPVEICPIFPDFKLWKYPCAQVIFDTDPAPVDKNYASQMELMSQAMIRGVMDESGEQFVAYFLPTEATLNKRKEDFIHGRVYEDDMEYDYKIYREYNWNVKTKASKGYEENYFFVFREDGVCYNELETRVRLSKRRLRAGATMNNTRLILKHRPTNASEFNIYRTREKNLLHPIEEEEDDDNEESEEEKKNDKKSDGKASGEDSNDEGSDKEDSDKEGSGKEDSDKEGSGKDDSDKESGKGEGSDKEEDSDKEGGSGKEAVSDKEEESGKEAASEKEEESGKENDSDNNEGSGKEEKSEKEDESEGSDKESEKGESDKEDARSGSEKSKGGESDAESSASGAGGRSGSASSGSASSHSGSDEE